MHSGRLLTVALIALMGCGGKPPEGHQQVALAIPDSGLVSRAVSRTLNWEDYWCGWWRRDVLLSLSGKSISTTVNSHDGVVDVYIDEIGTTLTFTSEDLHFGGGGEVSTFETDSRTYLSIKSERPDSGTNVNLTLNIEPPLVLPSLDSNAIELATEFVNDSKVRSDLIPFLKERGGSGIKRMRIGRFLRDYPRFYYYIEGEPYIGIVRFDPGSRSVLYHEYLFVDPAFADTPDRPYRNARIKHRLDENGEWISYRID